MMRWTRVVVVVAAVLVAVLAAGGMCRAGDRFGVAAKAGTLGIGVELTAQLNPWFGLRGSVNGFDYKHEFKREDINYDGDFRFGASGVFADFYPLRGRFRLSAAALGNRNKIDMTAAPTANVQIGDNTYTPGQVGVLNGEMKFHSAVTYFGIGYGNAARGPGRIGFVLDAGVMPQGEPTVTLTSSTGLVGAADLQKETAKLKDDLHHARVWPVIALGISIRL